MIYTQEYLLNLLNELRQLSHETEWVEFKHNNINPREIGEYISALANSSALAGKSSGYLVWGVEANTHNIIGTEFHPKQQRIGNEELENWLLRLLTPKVNFLFNELSTPNGMVVILEIERTSCQPVRFQGNEYIRIGSYKKTLKEFPEKERELWRIFDKVSFEYLLAAENISVDEVLKMLDYPSYFELVSQPLPDNKDRLIEKLLSDNLIIKNDAGNFNITNFGAILFAKRLDDFNGLKRKALRIIVYKGDTRIETFKEQRDGKGYACGFNAIIDYINNLIPRNEVIGNALRRDVPMYPEIAVRELVANAIIHQNFSIKGTGPMIEIFSNRIEITNPGQPLIKTERLLDSPPKSRNENIASFMRRIGVCEERGSGVDKVVFQTELYQLPAPLFEVVDDSTRVILFSHRPFSKMDKSDRTRAAYLHACLKYVQRETLTNASLRERFGIVKENSAMVSKIIRDAVAERIIKPVAPESESRKQARYIPFWA